MKKIQSYHKVHHQLRTHILKYMLVVMKGTGKGCGVVWCGGGKIEL